MARRRVRGVRSRKTSGSGLPLKAIVFLLVVAGLWSLVHPSPFVATVSVLLTIAVSSIGIGLYVWWRRRNQQRYLARLHTLSDLLLLTPTQFEYAVMELLRAWGYRDIHHTGGGGDLAADIICQAPNRLDTVVVQCKRYTPGKTVGSADVQQFIGMLTVHHRAQAGIYVTTSSYTRPALALGRQHRLQMIDGSQLASYVQQVNIQQQHAAQLQHYSW